MKIQTLAKYVDQPLVINKINNQMPKLLIGSGSAMAIYDAYKNRNDKREKNDFKLLKNGIIAASIIGATLTAVKKFKLIEIEPASKIIQEQAKAVDEYIKKTNLNDNFLLSILNKSKRNHLSLDEIPVLFEKLKNDSNRTVLFKKLFSENKSLTSNEIFSEIKRLSTLGAIPVASGIAGGIIADTVTATSSSKGNANKIKEGFYQYFANIFLCNVGAGTALFCLEKLHKLGIVKNLSPTKKMLTIMAGITAMGIVGGSYIANFLSKKIINPIFAQKKECGIYSERKPEPLDIALHADDIATAGVLSGVKWIEPMLPVMYFISGYRAGNGYRNVTKE